MKLMTEAVRAQLPALYSTEQVADPLARVKFFMSTLTKKRRYLIVPPAGSRETAA